MNFFQKILVDSSLQGMGWSGLSVNKKWAGPDAEE